MIIGIQYGIRYGIYGKLQFIWHMALLMENAPDFGTLVASIDDLVRYCGSLLRPEIWIAVYS